MPSEFSRMYSDLLGLSSHEWGEYAFSNDFLKSKVSDQMREEMIEKAIACGEQWADKILARSKQDNPCRIARELGIEIVKKNHQMTPKRALYAQFIPPGRIEIMTHPIKVYEKLRNNINKETVTLLPTPEMIEQVLIAHELFHFLEDKNADNIYTRTVKVRLWKLFRMKNDSTVRAVGEIAAMRFAACLTRLPYSPYLLDFLLFYGYHAKTAGEIYETMMSFYHKK